jgi:hypothetical protein
VRRPGGKRGAPKTEPDPPVQQNSKPEHDRQEGGGIHSRNRRDVSGGNVVDAEIEQLEQKCNSDRDQSAVQLPPAIELSGEQARKSDQREAECR